MPDAMIVLPRTSSDEEAHEVLLDALEQRSDQAAYLADELRCCGAEPMADALRLSRALRRDARMIQQLIDLEDEDVPDEYATTLLGRVQIHIDEAERMVLAADIRLAVDPDTFDEVEPSATAIGQLAMVYFASYMGEVTDMAEFMRVEREAPVPLMHALQRAAAKGFVRGRGEPVPEWLTSMLGRTLGEFLEGFTYEDGKPVTLLSSFMRIATVGCDKVAERWQAEQPTKALEAYAAGRREVVDAVLETLELQRERLPVLPELARAYDAGHAYGLIEPLLEEHARAQDFEPPRKLHAAHWFDLLMGSPADRG